MSPPQKDPDNPYYQLDLKCSGVNSGTFGSIGTVPTLRINTKGFVTFAGATTGIVIPPVITDFTIKGQNNLTSPLYTSLENYNPDQDEAENISGFLGNYGKSLYASSSWMYDKASGSMNIGVKCNSNNAINENNVSVGQRAMEDAYSKQCVAVGNYAISKSINSNSISIGHSVPVGGNNVPSNSDNIMIGSGIYNSSGKNSIFINNNASTQVAGGNATSNSISIGGYPHFGSTSDYSGIMLGQTYVTSAGITLQESIVIGNPDSGAFGTRFNPIYKTSVVVSQFGTGNQYVLLARTLESSVHISSGNIPQKYYRDPIDGPDHVIIGGGAGIIGPYYSNNTFLPSACIAIGTFSTASTNGISIGYRSGSFLSVKNGELPNFGYLGAAFSGGYNGGKFGIGPPESPPKLYPVGVTGNIIPGADYTWGANVNIVSGGQTHNIALVKASDAFDVDKIFVCGDNSAGQLGFGDTTPRYTYTRVPIWAGTALSGSKIKQVCAYYNGTYIITTTGSLWGCGQISPTRNSNTFVEIDSYLTGVWTEISVARDYATGKTTWAGIKGGFVFTMGDNTFGQLGRGTTGGSTDAFVLVGNDVCTKIQCGKSFVMAVRNDKRLLAWGKNDVGQLGLGNSTNYNTPQIVPLFISQVLGGTPTYDTSSIVSMSAGYECAVVVTTNGNTFMAGKIWPYFSSLSYTKLAINKTISTAPYIASATQCLVIDEYNVFFMMSDKSICAIGRGDDGAFFAGASPLNSFTGTPQALNPANLTTLSQFQGTNAMLPTGFVPGALVIVPKLGGMGEQFNRICLAAEGQLIPNFLIIGGAGGKLLGKSDGTGVESSATSGSASSLPSTPSAYLSAFINGTKYKLPLYNI